MIRNAPRVINAGVGKPSGVAGTPEIDLHCPSIKIQHRLSRVQGINSGSAPAIVMPGIWLVSV